MEKPNYMADKRKILNDLYVTLDELCFECNATYRRSKKIRFTGQLNNHALNRLMHGCKSLAEEKQILREQRDVASLKSLEVLKKTIRWNPCLNNWEKLLGDIEQFQIEWERAAGNASVKEKISNYEPLKKTLKDQTKEMRSSTIFKRIWAWKGPQRIKIFLWKLHKGALLTNYERVRRGLTNDASCKVCSAAEETILHAIRYCDHAKTVWSCIVPIVALRDFFSLDNAKWVEQNLTRSMGSYGSNHWSIIFGVTAYCIWQARNELIFQNLRSSHVEIIRRVWHNLGEIMVTCDVRSGASCGSALNSETSICWHAPPDLWIKVMHSHQYCSILNKVHQLAERKDAVSLPLM